MMKLSEMKVFLEDEEAGRIIKDLLHSWEFDEKSIQLVRASSNFIFRFHEKGEDRILRLTPNASAERIKTEMDFLQELHNKYDYSFYPLSARDGSITKTADYRPIGKLTAAVFPFIHGELYEASVLDSSQLENWGSALGKFHLASQGFHESIIKEAETLLQKLEWIDITLKNSNKAVRREFEAVSDWMMNLHSAEGREGIIHFDFELDNMIWDGEKIHPIDFESFSYSWFAADIAFALRDLPIGRRGYDCFIEGYRRHMDISEEELSWIPMFQRWHDLYTHAAVSRARDINFTSGQESHWLYQLNEKLNRKLRQYILTIENK
ncbi:phosphotransferase [Bacillus infantis]|uniref:phosphotransferase enzyme family protein n=1 Tax=Bacillus infantis TaxID=324767 RepID=UPI001CD7A0B6|nr:phosphotransferase [Bacillus infantis]MCA1038222.1 phosphotransferase [Bacillus infantis]